MDNTIYDSFKILKTAIHTDHEMAWGWQCNLAMSVMDSTGISHKMANLAGAHLMSHIFDYDITKNQFYLDTQTSPDILVDILIAVTKKERLQQDEDFLLDTLLPSVERGDLDEVLTIASLLK